MKRTVIEQTQRAEIVAWALQDRTGWTLGVAKRREHFMTSLGERRAIFVYEAARVENVAARRPINPEPWARRDLRFRTNMIRAVARQCGMRRLTSPKQLHDAWVRAYQRMGWIYGSVRDVKRKTHPDMVPFSKLGRLEREKDWVFFMLCEIARRMR